MGTNIITLEQINKSFGGVKVLNNVNFMLEKGEVHALVGGNGAGKSTLMKILTGVYKSDSGKVKVNGETVTINNPLDAQKYGIQMIFQELSLSPTLTVSENIFLAHEIKKGFVLNKKEMENKTKKLLNDLGLDIDPKARISNLDVGVCQLVEIAKALAQDSSVLVMDEPTASLNEREVQVLFGIIEKLKNAGVSIVYISHRMREIFQIADKIAVLKDGKIVEDKAKEEFTMESLIDDMIGKKVEKVLEYSRSLSKEDSSYILEAEHLNYGNRVNDFSIKLRKGEVLGFAGLMGTGKTEVMEILFGLKKQGRASIKIEGKPVRIRNVADAIKNGIVLVPEDRRRQGLVLIHSLKDNVSLPNYKKLTKLGLIIKRRVNRMSKDSVNELNIKTDSIDKRLGNLSGGNQQKVVVAKWIKTKPKIFLMDEPTAGIDIGAKAELIETIRNLTKQGNSVIFVSSELGEMLAICDRVLVFSNGKISKEYLREEIESEGALQYAIQH